MSIAPRDTYRKLGGPAAEEGEIDLVDRLLLRAARASRRRALTRRLIAARGRPCAGAKGATIVEAYPVDEASPSYRFMGFVPVFADAGFTEAGRAGTRRHVMRLKVQRS